MDLSLQRSYRSGRDHLLDDFYVPCLGEAIRYDRAVGYFSSSLYQVVGLAFSGFVKRGGRMRLICSPALSSDDFDAMKSAEVLAQEAQESVRRDLEDLLSRPEAIPATKLLATLIANGILEVRVAFSRDPKGIFHDKLGIFEDSDYRRVTFVGSANETWRAWGRNHESFEVFTSWANENDLLRTRDHADAFQDLWLGDDPGVDVRRLDDVTYEQLEAIADADLDHALEVARGYAIDIAGSESGRELMEHQRLVLEDWEAHEHRGVVNFATGAGKTLTAIEAVRRWSQRGGASVVLVPGKDLHAQWIREIDSEIPNVRLLPAGAGSSKTDWQALLPLYSAPRSEDDPPHVVVSTMQTFVSEDFQRRLRQGEHLLVVADEMHRAGSSSVLPALESVACGASMGLSATYQRQFDPDSTERLLEVFGPVLSPSVGIAEALLMELLVPYDYRLHEVQLEDDEIDEYDRLSVRIGQTIAQSSTKNEISDSLRMLLIKRARILKQARRKVPTALEVLLAEFRDGDRWLAYCDNLAQLNELIASCLEHGLPAIEFHSNMKSDREVVLGSLRDHGGIVVAIRCLDEGIDIPVTDHAIILASSTVQREYVQRRGRVLRRAPEAGKVSAEIHDLILVSPVGGALTKGEAIRALEFARLARNEAARDRLKALIALSDDPLEIAESLYENENENENEDEDGEEIE